MQRLTPQEFYKQYFGRDATDNLIFVEPLKACEFAKAYAEHFEASAWIDVQRLTPQEFLATYYPSGYPSAEQWLEDAPDFMPQYAEHLEASAWVTDGSLPPVEPLDSEYSQNVLAVYEFGGEAVVYAQLRSKNWYTARSHDKITPPIKWRPLPTPPK